MRLWYEWCKMNYSFSRILWKYLTEDDTVLYEGRSQWLSTWKRWCQRVVSKNSCRVHSSGSDRETLTSLSCGMLVPRLFRLRTKRALHPYHSCFVVASIRQAMQESFLIACQIRRQIVIVHGWTIGRCLLYRGIEATSGNYIFLRQKYYFLSVDLEQSWHMKVMPPCCVLAVM